MMPNRTIPVAVLLAFAVRAHRAYAEPANDAEQMYQVGQAAFDSKQYDDAITAWQRSFVLSNEPGLLFNMAQAYRLRNKQGDCAKARDAYEAFLERDATSDQRAVARGFVQEMDRCVARETSTSNRRTPPATDAQSAAQERDAGGTNRIAGLGIAGGGVALLATGFYFGHRASSLGDEVTRACTNGCDWAVYGPKDAAGTSAQTTQYVFDGLGLAAIVGGGVLYWPGSRKQARPPISFSSSRDGAVIAWSGSW